MAVGDFVWTIGSWLQVDCGQADLSGVVFHRPGQRLLAGPSRPWLFQFEHMPFVMCRLLSKGWCNNLSGQLSESLLVYLADIIIYSPDFSSHLQHLDEVFKRLRQHGLKLQLEKCKLLQYKLKFLGHVGDQDEVRPDPNKISAVLDWSIPTTIKQVQAFLGLVSYYNRCFVLGFAKVTRSLNQVLTGIPTDKKSEARKV